MCGIGPHDGCEQLPGRRHRLLDPSCPRAMEPSRGPLEEENGPNQNSKTKADYRQKTKYPCSLADLVDEGHMSQPQNYQRPLYQRRFIQYCFFAFSLENDRGLTKNDTPEHGLCWTFELELPKSNLCTVPVLKAATCDLEVAASKQKPLRLTRDRRKLRPSSWSCRSVTCALRLW